MFVRHALLTAYGHVSRQEVGAPTDILSSSTASFRQALGAVSHAAVARRARSIRGLGIPGLVNRLRDLMRLWLVSQRCQWWLVMTKIAAFQVKKMA